MFNDTFIIPESRAGVTSWALPLSFAAHAVVAAALDAVRQWIYEPMIVNGRPRGVVFAVTVRFALK
ncbi:MAG: hypothetical protein NTW38_07525 [Candidatus Aminicenantes bacterium]|nr:hypothetical protein [Candidatus Aminicenantes bacterium]